MKHRGEAKLIQQSFSNRCLIHVMERPRQSKPVSETEHAIWFDAIVQLILHRVVPG